MNEDDMGVHEEPAGDELERMLARYARVRLDPSQAATRRARTAVMEEAWRRRLAASPVPVPRARRRGLFAGWSPRRLGATLAAAVMAGLLVGSTVFATSRAGGPLYGARLAIETLALPGDTEARLEAELASAQTRLAEAVDASVRDDHAALAAALDAYGETIHTLETATGPGAERALEVVRVHRAVLEGVLEGAPASAASGLSRAIAQSDALILRLDATLSTGAPGDQGGQGGPPSTKPGTAATPEPAATPRATKAPKPDPTPKATKAPKPETTTKPGRTPKPRPTPQAPDGAAGDRGVTP